MYPLFNSNQSSLLIFLHINHLILNFCNTTQYFPSFLGLPNPSFSGTFFMTTVTLTSARNADIVRNLGYGNTAHHRDPSLSSYLGINEETVVLKRGELTRMPSVTTISPRVHAYHRSLGRKKNGYGEISVFGAERYFNGLIDKNTAIRVPKNDEKVEIHDMQQETRITTSPSAFSKASWCSKTAFLPVKQSRKNFFAKFGCNCSDKKSVEVEENTLDITCIKCDPVPCRKQKSIDDGIDSEDCFSLNILNPSVGNLPLEIKIDEVEEANARESLEVHMSPLINMEEIPWTLDKLAMLNWDPVVASEANSDIDSDSSSDLFELKGLSDGGHPFFRRQPSDGMSDCVSPSSVYEPNEASTNWSVATTSAANLEYDEAIPKEIVRSSDNLTTTANMANITIAAKAGISKDTAKRFPSILLGCKSHRAVKVIGARKLPEKKPESTQVG